MTRLRLRLDLRFRSIRTRLMVWNVCVLAVILGVLGGILNYTLKENLIASVDGDLEAMTHPMPRMPGFFSHPRPDFDNHGRDPVAAMETFVRTMDKIMEPGSPAHGSPRNGEAHPPAIFAGHASDARRPRLFHLDGTPLSLFDNAKPWDTVGLRSAARGERPHRTIVVDGEQMRVYSAPVRHSGKVIAVVQTAYSLTDIKRAMEGMDRTLLALVPVGLLLAGIGGAMLTERGLRPVGRIAQTTEQIGAHDLSQRLPQSGEDEFAHLAGTINGMLERLDTAFAQREVLVRQLETLVAQQRRFTADASHELRTPLTIIKANTSLVLSATATESEYREAITDIDRAAGTMNRLVQDLLLLARADEGRLQQNFVHVSLAKVLERSALSLCTRPTATVCFDAPDPRWVVLGDAEELYRVFLNLLENASRYTPLEGEITIRVEAEAGNYVVRVADTGIGIAPEHLPHLGERFYRVDAARSRPDGGAGLGLSICKSIVESHQGRMCIESTPGVGTCVSIYLPALV